MYIPGTEYTKGIGSRVYRYSVCSAEYGRTLRVHVRCTEYKLGLRRQSWAPGESVRLLLLRTPYFVLHTKYVQMSLSQQTAGGSTGFKTDAPNRIEMAGLSGRRYAMAFEEALTTERV